MDKSPHFSNPLTIALTRGALCLLAAAVIIGELVLVVGNAQSLAAAYPEFANLQGPLVFAALAFGVCVEIVLLVTGVLVGYTRDSRIFGPSALKLVDLMVSALGAATAFVVFALFYIPGPPALALLLLGGALMGAAFVLVVLVLRSLLRAATVMRVELDEVV
jgi:hypothetical protein